MHQIISIHHHNTQKLNLNLDQIKIKTYVISWFRSIFLNLACVIWLTSFSKSQKSRKTFSKSLTKYHFIFSDVFGREMHIYYSQFHQKSKKKFQILANFLKLSQKNIPKSRFFTIVFTLESSGF